MAMFLTTEELEELTGKVRPSAQVRELIRQGYRPDIRIDGRPVLAREAVLERQMQKKRSRPTRTVEPNFDWMREENE